MHDFMLIADTADALGLGVTRTAQLDPELQPARVGRHGVRVYSRDRVDFVAGRRLARSAA